MRKTPLIITAMTVAAAFALAAEAGTSTAAFLKIGVGARAAAMGDAAAALAEGPEALYWNPAGLATLERRAVSFTHNEWLADVRYEYAGFSYPFPAVGTFGLAASLVTMGDLVGRDEQGNYTGNFSASDLALTVGYGRRLWSFLAAGLTAEYVSSKIEAEEANTFAGGAGVTVNPPLRGLSAGVSVAHAGGEMTFVEEGAPLPLAVRGGFAYQLPFGGNNHRFTVAADALKYRDTDTYGNAGVEYWLLNAVALRGGYKFNYDLDGLTAGMGFRYAPAAALALGADYAYGHMGDLGSTHRVTVGVMF